MDNYTNFQESSEENSLDDIQDAVYEESISDDVLCYQVNWIHVLKNNRLSDGQIRKYKNFSLYSDNFFFFYV
jgi:hypothetical protein